MPTDDDSHGHTLWHQSGVNAAGEPFVQLLLDDEIIGLLTPQLARDHARALTEAAEAAEQDAFLFHWLQAQVGVDKSQAAHFIADFRRYRAERTGKSQGPTRPTEFVMPAPSDNPDYGDITKKKRPKPHDHRP